MSEEIIVVDDDYLAVVETTVNETLIKKTTLQAQRAALVAQIAEIDVKINLFPVQAGP